MILKTFPQSLILIKHLFKYIESVAEKKGLSRINITTQNKLTTIAIAYFILYFDKISKSFEKHKETFCNGILLQQFWLSCLYKICKLYWSCFKAKCRSSNTEHWILLRNSYFFSSIPWGVSNKINSYVLLERYHFELFLSLYYILATLLCGLWFV